MPPPWAYAPPPPPRTGWFGRVARVLVLTLLAFSLLLNLSLGGALYLQVGGPGETVLREGEGPLGKHVTVLPIVGAIDADTAWFAGDALRRLRGLERLGQMPDALVLRVDSGGGGVTASDQIWRAVADFKAAFPELPVIASFGGVAASGGYYVAAGCDRIFIEPTGMTGSIGVIAQVPTLQEAMNKIGVDWVTVVAEGSPAKDSANNLYRDWTDADREVISTLVDDAYARFTEVVVAGRSGLTQENVGQVADGRVFASSVAVENGLVDEIGYLDDAIDSLAPGLGVDPERLRVTVLNRGESGVLGLLGLHRENPLAAAPLELGTGLGGRVSEASLRRLMDSLGGVRVAYASRLR